MPTEIRVDSDRNPCEFQPESVWILAGIRVESDRNPQECVWIPTESAGVNVDSNRNPWALAFKFDQERNQYLVTLA